MLGVWLVLTVALAIAVAALVNFSGEHPSTRAASARSRQHRPDGQSARTAGAAPGEDPTARGPAAAAGPPVLGRPVSVSVAARPTGAAVPGDFVGLSFEMRSLPTLAGYANRGNLVALMRSLGHGVMRFGGASADEQVAWVGPGAARPGWASTAVSENDLSGLAALARATGWSVLLTVNLGHYDPAAAAQEVKAARALLGGALAGVEIGNEPDLYARKHMRAAGWELAAYLSQAAVYRTAIEKAAPGTPIAGPDPSTGVAGLRWVRAAASTLHPEVLTDHYYPLSSCGYRPTVSELLSPNIRRSESEMLGRMMAIAHAHATPLRVDETNSISCEGRAGVSNTFASALWALDYSARAMAAGAVGVNFHDLIAKPGAYSPLLARGPGALAAGTLHAEPEWYALLAAHELNRAGGRVLPTKIAGADPGELSASALSAPGGRARLLLVDYDPPGSPPLAVHLGVGRTFVGGSVLRLTAPSLAAASGVRLGGRAVAADGTWTPPSALPAVSGRPGSLAVQIAPGSAAVLTLSPAAPAGRAALPG
jgi:hypothetical protein